MNKLLLLVGVLAVSLSSFANNLDEFSGNHETKMFATESEAIAVAMKLEDQIKNQKYKSFLEYVCDSMTRSPRIYKTDKFEVKKYYVGGIGKYQAVVYFKLFCEEEYDD